MILPGFEERLYLLNYGGGNIAIEVGPEGTSLPDYLDLVEPIIDSLEFAEPEAPPSTSEVAEADSAAIGSSQRLTPRPAGTTDAPLGYSSTFRRTMTTTGRARCWCSCTGTVRAATAQPTDWRSCKPPPSRS